MLVYKYNKEQVPLIDGCLSKIALLKIYNRILWRDGGYFFMLMMISRIKIKKMIMKSLSIASPSFKESATA